jgi:hypothetical protein
MAEYKLDPPGVIRTSDGAQIPPDENNSDWLAYQDWLEEGNTPDPADPPPLEYSRAVGVEARVRTTDDVALEVFRFATVQKELYQASLTISGIDAANQASKIMEGRFTWKRPGAVAVMVGITVVSDIHDTAAAAWQPNALPEGTDIVFTVKGAAGRTIDWLLVGSVGVYAPEGLGG